MGKNWEDTMPHRRSNIERKLARGKATAADIRLLAESALIWLRTVEAVEAAWQSKRTRRHRDDSQSFLEKLHRLEDPRG